MSRKTISLSIIGMMLTATFVITGMTVGRSKPKHVVGSSQQKPDPPGTINGATNPELVSDHVAWSAIFAMIASHKTAEQKQRIRGYINLLGLGCDKCKQIQGAAESGDEIDIDKMIVVAAEYDKESKALDKSAGFPLPAPASLPEQELKAKVQALKKQKEQLVATKVAYLSQHLSGAGYATLISNLDKVKRGIKIVPYPPMPPGK